MYKNLLLIALTLLPAAFGQAAPNAGNWKTWILSSGKAITVPPPPSDAATAGELSWLKEFAAQNDPRITAQIKYWDAGPPAYRWVDFVTARQIAGQAVGAPNVNRPSFSSTSQMVTESTSKTSETSLTAAGNRSACCTREAIASVKLRQTVR